MNLPDDSVVIIFRVCRRLLFLSQDVEDQLCGQGAVLPHSDPEHEQRARVVDASEEALVLKAGEVEILDL